MKKNHFLLCVCLCFLTISGTVFATNHASGPIHIKKVKPLSTKAKVPTSISFLIINYTAHQPYSYSFNGSYGGVINPGSSTYVTLPIGTYSVSMIPANYSLPFDPPRVDFVFNNGVGWYGDPGHTFSSVSIGNGSGEASSLTVTIH